MTGVKHWKWMQLFAESYRALSTIAFTDPLAT